MKIIKEFPSYGVYQTGHVVNLNSGRILKPDENSCGYLRVTLSKNNKQKRVFIHRLVAELFVDNKNGFNQVNHKDGNKQNNNYTNLEWCNQSLNQKHAYLVGLQVVKTKVSEEQVHEICKRLQDLEPVSKIYREVFATQDIVADIKRRRTWKHISKDYIF